MMSAQQMNLQPKTLPKTTPFLAKVYLLQCGTTSQCLSSYGCAITIDYVNIYIYICI